MQNPQLVLVVRVGVMAVGKMLLFGVISIQQIFIAVLVLKILDACWFVESLVSDGLLVHLEYQRISLFTSVVGISLNMAVHF